MWYEDAIVNLEAPLGTYGAVEFAYRSRLLPQSSWSLVSIALFIAAAAGLMAIVPRKN
jgi:hypothetical protein